MSSGTPGATPQAGDRAGTSGRRTLVFTATYDEREAAPRLVREVLALDPSFDLLVVDDNSPDGTGDVLEEIAGRESRLQVVRRPRKMGLGTAHKLAMLYAIQQGYDALVTMDADGSHAPRDIPRLLEQLGEMDFVIGSRYTAGGSSDLTGYRLALSKLANFSARLLLPIRLHEFTTSFRAFRVPALAQIDVGNIRSQGYSFFLETVFRIHMLGFRITETPIHFAHRVHGASKIPRLEIFNGIGKLSYLFLSRLANPRPVRSGNPLLNSACYACGSRALVDRFPPRHILEQQRRRGSDDTRLVQCLRCGLLAAGNNAPTSALPIDETGVEHLERSFGAVFDQAARHLPQGGKVLQAGPGASHFARAARRQGWICNELTIEEIRTLHLPEETYDAIGLWEILDRVGDPLALLQAAAARLRPNGILLLAVRDSDALLPRMLGRSWPLIDGGRRFYLSDAVVRDWLGQAGFEVREVGPRRRYLSASYAARKLAAALPRPIAWVFRLAWPRLPRHPGLPVAFGHDKLVVATRRVGPAKDPRDRKWAPSSAHLRKS